MRIFLRSLPLVLCALGLCRSGATVDRPRHYVFFNRDREHLADARFLNTRAFEGAQVKYTWRELEPEQDRYEFGAVDTDLAFLTGKGKRLFLQLQDVSFTDDVKNVPPYLLRGEQYRGGVARQYEIEGDDEAHARPGGWVARRWDPAVQERFHRLLAALGQRFNGRVEGITLPETAVDFGESGRLYPEGFTPAAYRDAIIQNMRALKRAFPTSVAMQYANFMPGEWLPADDHSYLRSVYQAASELKVGVGGPDLLPGRPGQMNHSYPLIRAASGGIPTAIAVQWGNYEQQNPGTGRRVTVRELLAFAGEYLRVDYLFWCEQEPFYGRDVVPLLREGR
jgi:hypothetical protein